MVQNGYFLNFMMAPGPENLAPGSFKKKKHYQEPLFHNGSTPGLVELSPAEHNFTECEVMQRCVQLKCHLSFIVQCLL